MCPKLASAGSESLFPWRQLRTAIYKNRVWKHIKYSCDEHRLLIHLKIRPFVLKRSLFNEEPFQFLREFFFRHCKDLDVTIVIPPAIGDYRQAVKISKMIQKTLQSDTPYADGGFFPVRTIFRRLFAREKRFAGNEILFLIKSP